MATKDEERWERLAALGFKREMPTPEGQAKMSAVIMQLAEPLIRQHAETVERAKAIISLTIAAWNKSMFPPEKQPLAEKELIDHFVPKDGPAEVVGLLVHIMETVADRQKELFPDLRKAIVDYKIEVSGDTLNLNVSSAPLPNLAREDQKTSIDGGVAERLYRKLASKAHNLPTKEPKRRPGELLPRGVKDIETLIKEGHDPIHAVYIFIHNLTSRFGELVSSLPEMRAWADAVSKAEDEYLPSGPPMSPLTGSYFWCWALYDLRIGKSTDTLASCQIAANDVIWMNLYQLDVAKRTNDSRMGIYEHIGTKGQHILLRELVSDDQFLCLCTSGYLGHEGELWYVRLLPPLEPQLARYWITMTTPYILMDASKSDWITFLKRTMLQCGGPQDDWSRLHNLLKFGLEPNYWNEFVFKAYHHHQQDAIFLTGIPDLKATLPHA
jgi:hypothetical protein